MTVRLRVTHSAIVPPARSIVRKAPPTPSHACVLTCVKMDATPSTETRVPGATRSASDRSTASVMWRGISPVGTDSGASCVGWLEGAAGTERVCSCASCHAYRWRSSNLPPRFRAPPLSSSFLPSPPPPSVLRTCSFSVCWSTKVHLSVTMTKGSSGHLAAPPSGAPPPPSSGAADLQRWWGVNQNRNGSR